MRKDGPVPLGISRVGGCAVVYEESVAVRSVSEVLLEGGHVLVCGEVVGGVGVTRSVGLCVDSCGGTDGSGAAHPVWRADGFVRLVGAGAGQPGRTSGLHLDVADLLGFGDGCGDVDVAVSDVGPCEAREFFGADSGEEEQGEGCAGIHRACVHEAGGFIRGVNDDGLALDLDSLHARVGRFLYKLAPHCPGEGWPDGAYLVSAVAGGGECDFVPGFQRV